MQKEIKYVLIMMVALFGYIVATDQGWIGAKASVASPVAVTGTTTVSGKNICLGGETQSLTISGVSIDDRTSAITEATNLYRRKGDTSWTAWTLGTAITALSAGSDYEFVVGTGLTDHTDNAYGPNFVIDNMPCRVQFTLPVYNDEDESGTTFTYYNADDNAAAESFSANEVQTVSVKTKAAAEQYFGNPSLTKLDNAYTDLQSSLKANGVGITFKTPGDAFPNVLYYQLNSTSWDKPDQIYLADGTKLPATNCPIRVTANDTEDITYCYKAPIITGTQLRIYSDLNTDDTIAPAFDDTFGYLAAGYYVNGDNAELLYGVEDEDANAVGVDAAETVVLDNT